MVCCPGPEYHSFKSHLSSSITWYFQASKLPTQRGMEQSAGYKFMKSDSVVFQSVFSLLPIMTQIFLLTDTILWFPLDAIVVVSRKSEDYMSVNKSARAPGACCSLSSLQKGRLVQHKPFGRYQYILMWEKNIWTVSKNACKVVELPTWSLYRTEIFLYHPLTTKLPADRSYSAFQASET